jgi:hypothetical protein
MASTFERSSVFNKNSRYVAGGTTEVNQTALEWWERINLTTDPTDGAYVVEKKFEGRLDLITAVHLGEKFVANWWVIAMINNILDPYTEIYEGRILYIPTRERMAAILNGRLGGAPSSREIPTSILPIV